MAKGAQAAVAARVIMTEVMPPEVVSIMRGRKVPICSLDTIAEADEKEQQLLPNQTAAAWVKRAAAPQPQPPERAKGLLRELSKYFADGGYGGDGSWESSGRHGHRQVAYVAQPLRIRSGPYMAPYVLGY